MKYFLPFALATELLLPLAPSQSATPVPPSEGSIASWGVSTDPDGDCKFSLAGNELMIAIPAAKPHDLSAEIGIVNAPRVLQPVNGDFVIQTKVGGRQNPGNASTIAGRTSYQGAGLVLMADPQNAVTLARAVLEHTSGEPVAYANFEMRTAGALDQIGSTGDLPLPLSSPVYLRLQRRDQTITASVSEDGVKWQSLPTKELPASWPQDLKVGVTAISSSKEEFTPHFSDL